MRQFYWNGEGNFMHLVNEFQSEGMHVVEVGCYDGSTTRMYLDTVRKNNGHVTIIDTFEGTKQSEEFLKNNPSYLSMPHVYGSHNDDLYDWVVEQFKEYSDMMTIIKGYSYDIIPTFPDGSVDILFIDADHTYQNVKRDIELSIPKVKPGGILSGHDCESFDRVNTYSEYELNSDYVNGQHCGTIQAVYDKFGKTRLNGWVWSVKL